MKTLHRIQGQQERASYEYTGYLLPGDGVFYLTYTEQTETSKQRTLITYSPRSVAVKRAGELSLRMLFSPEETTDALYEMAAGKLAMEIQTSYLAVETGKNPHHIRLEYQLFSGGAGIGEYQMELEIDPL